jgi:2'-5' RNA ligase
MRLFYAVPCSSAATTQVLAWRKEQRMDGRLVPAANLHMTLAFLGEIPPEHIEALLTLGSELHLDQCTVVLDRAERWHQGLISLVASVTPAPLAVLVNDLNKALKPLGIKVDRRPFVPHLTVARKTRHHPHALPAIEWVIDRFGLYVSESLKGQVAYRILKEWPGSNS